MRSMPLIFLLLCSVANAAPPETKVEDPGLYRIQHKLGDVIIGKPNDFKPKAKLNRWGGECFIEVSYPTSKRKNADHANNRVKWEDDNVDVVMYPKTENDFEFEVILKTRPLRDFVVLDIESRGLEFYYQEKELTPFEISQNAFRPDNVKGSYAVYHATRKVWHKSKAEADKYKTGKAFHIYRPELIDTDGNRIWADLNINIASGKMRITMDGTWLDNAVYPVVVDPTFGYTGIGGSGSFVSQCLAQVDAGSRYTASTGDTITTFHLYGTSQAGAGPLQDMAVYTFVGGVPVDRLAAAVTITTTDAGLQWWTAATSQVMNNGVDYCVALGNDGPGNSGTYYDASQTISVDQETGAMPATWVEDTTITQRRSAYATYTEAPASAGQVIIVTKWFDALDAYDRKRRSQ